MVKYHKISGLGNLLQSLTLNPPADKSEYDTLDVISVDTNRTIDKDGNGNFNIIKPPKVTLWYRNHEKFTIDSLEDLVTKQLRIKGHPINKGTFIVFLTMFHVTLENSEAAVSYLEELLENLIPARATLFQVLVQPSTDLPTFQFGDYSYGKLSIKKLRDLCKAAKSDYLDRYHSELEGRLTIMRTIDQLALINWQPYIQRRHAIRIVPGLGSKVLWLMDEYFSRIQEPLFERFYSEMIEHQQIYIALGSSYIDPDIHKTLLGTNRITGYEYLGDFKPNGFISPHMMAKLSVNLGAAPFQIPALHMNLKKDYGFSGFLDTELHHTIETYTRFLTRARIHKDRGNINEAFLHYVIALDLIFGGTEQITKTIAKRVAAMTHRMDKDSKYDSQMSLVSGYYNLRSKYVHEGRTIEPDALNRISDLCGYILHAFLYLQKRSPELQISTWLKELDIIVAQLEAEKIPDEESLLSCGIIDTRN